MTRRGGFSLIEMVAVVAIIALAAGLAGWWLENTGRAATAEQVVGRLLAYEARARTYARRFRRPVELVYRMHEVSARVLPTPRQTEGEAWTPVPMAEGVVVDQLRPASAGTRVRIAGTGRSRSYAVEIDGIGEGQRWLFFAGLTGEAHLVDNPETIDRLLALDAAQRLEEIVPERPDAD